MFFIFLKHSSGNLLPVVLDQLDELQLGGKERERKRD